MASLMHTKKVMTTTLAVLAIMTGISLVAASSNGFVILAFAVKNGGSSSDKSGTSSSDKSSLSTSKKGTSSGTTGASTGSKSKFIKCITAVSGSLSRTDVDNCWDQVFGSSGSSGASGLTLGPSTSSSGSSSSKHSS